MVSGISSEKLGAGPMSVAVIYVRYLTYKFCNGYIYKRAEMPCVNAITARSQKIQDACIVRHEALDRGVCMHVRCVMRICAMRDRVRRVCPLDVLYNSERMCKSLNGAFRETAPPGWAPAVGLCACRATHTHMYARLRRRRRQRQRRMRRVRGVARGLPGLPH